MAEVTTILSSLSAEVAQLKKEPKLKLQRENPPASPQLNSTLKQQSKALEDKLLSHTNTLLTLEKQLKDHALQIEVLTESGNQRREFTAIARDFKK